MSLNDIVFRILEKERKSYEVPFLNDMSALERVIRPGDVMLVCGNTYLGEIIKWMTRSTWSHCAIYAGEKTLIEADNIVYKDGKTQRIEPKVIESPLEKYSLFNIRLKRPVQITSEDLATVLATVRGEMGKKFDRKNLINFLLKNLGLRSFEPFESMGSANKYLCAALLARAFQEVGYPVIPELIRVEKESMKFRQRNYTHCAPGDFDRASSHYWQTIPFERFGQIQHYKEIQWEQWPLPEKSRRRRRDKPPARNTKSVA